MGILDLYMKQKPIIELCDECREWNTKNHNRRCTQLCKQCADEMFQKAFKPKNLIK